MTDLTARSYGSATAPCRDLNAGRCRFGAVPSAPHNFQTLNGLVYFIATSPSGASQVWRTDGTAAGTTLVNDFGAAVVSQIQANDGILYIHAGNSLWRSDGTNAGTQLLASPSNGINGSIVPSGTLVFFLGNDTATGVELWVSDGTAAGTHITRDIVAGPATSSPKLPVFPVGQYYNLYNLALSRQTTRATSCCGRTARRRGPLCSATTPP